MNPYTNRLMIRNSEDFYDRKIEVKRIFSRIGGSRPQSISIVGERRIGKSSLLFHICNENVRNKYLEKPEKYLFVFFDLQEKKNMNVEEFFHLVIEKILEQLFEEPDENLIHEFSYESFLNFVKNIGKDDMNLILIFDEFDIVTNNENFGPEFFSYLRSIANSFNVAYITSSRKNLQKLCHTSEIKDSPFFNIFTHIPLGPFDRESALELIGVPSKRENVPLEDYSEFIFELAGFHPFFIQVACSNLFEYLTSHEVINEKGFENVRDNFFVEAESHFEYIWNHLENEEQQCLANIAESRELNTKLIFIARKLERRGLHTKDDETYQIFSKCFKDYILSKIEKEKVEEVLKVEEDILSNPNRRKILLKLEENPREIKELVDYMKISRPAIIKHLKFLKEKNLIREDIVLKPRIKKLYHMTEQGKKFVSTSQTSEENSENFVNLKVLPSKKKDEGRYLVRVPKGVHSRLGTKGRGRILLIGKNEKTVQCEVKTTYDFDSEERIVLVNEMIREILDVEQGDEIKVKNQNRFGTKI